jgi:hypothetical protein
MLAYPGKIINFFSDDRCCRESKRVLQSLFSPKEERGVDSSKGFTGDGHKLIRVIFAMLSRRTYFQEEMAQKR